MKCVDEHHTITQVMGSNSFEACFFWGGGGGGTFFATTLVAS